MESKIDYEINDSELVYYVKENDEVKDYLFEKYKPMIHKEINRVKKSAYALGIDFADLTQEAMLGFSNAINGYDGDSDAKFLTFATLVVRRKLSTYVRKFATGKNTVEKNALALESIISESEKELIDSIQDESKEPLHRIITDETLSETHKKMMEKLSENEKKALLYSAEGTQIKDIAEYMGLTSKQVYNLLHRARQKLKE